jgi:hypothetical protein
LSCVRLARAKINGAIDSQGRPLGGARVQMTKKRGWWQFWG